MLTSLEMIDSPRLAKEEWRGAELDPPWGCSFLLPRHGITTVLLYQRWSPQSPNTPPSHPCLVTSKLLQSAQALIGLGQVSAVHNLMMGPVHARSSPLYQFDCVVAGWREGGMFVFVRFT